MRLSLEYADQARKVAGLATIANIEKNESQAKIKY